jgi:subtilase family serine protease
MKDLIFFNHFHNGDLHVSRTYINDIIENYKMNTSNIYYEHKCDMEILKDLDVIQNKIITVNDEKILYVEKDNKICFNTWYNPYAQPLFNVYGCSLKTLHANFKILYDKLNLQIKDMDFYIPNINFSKINTDNIDIFMKKNNYDKLIFISNGNVLSGQSINFNFDQIISELCKIYKSYLFIVSNDTLLKFDNLIMSSNIIGKNNCDLNENAYLSTFCDVIIGRLSGTHTFSYIKENITGNKKQINISISNINPYFGLEEFIAKNKQFIWLRDMNVDIITKRIKEIIHEI